VQGFLPPFQAVRLSCSLVPFTLNPQWPEIRESLFEGQTATDRSGIVVRVFKKKLDELLKLFKDGSFFGRVVGMIHVVEFQKRGSSHAHILNILDSEDKPSIIATVNQMEPSKTTIL
jgi:hypothetical protein